MLHFSCSVCGPFEVQLSRGKKAAQHQVQLYCSNLDLQTLNLKLKFKTENPVLQLLLNCCSVLQ